MRGTLRYVLLCLLAAGCASLETEPPASNDLNTKAEITPPATPKVPVASGRSTQEIENLTIGEVIRLEEPNTANLYDNSRYDFPITINSKVEAWIDYFTGRGRPHMERYLGRSSRYIPKMKEILKRNGLPEDLVYLALIESGFNLRAKSHARAVGPWQFMKGTGTRYGLRVDAWVDERRDPLKATEAAAMYLKDLYLMFESWYLAASAYNAGEYKILRAIDSQNTHNFWAIAQSNAIRRETKEYVPKLISAAIIAKNPAKYGFEDIAYEDPLEYETLRVDFPIQLKEVAAMVEASEDEILDLNPAFIRHMTPPEDGPYELRVPPGARTLVERALSSMREKALAAVELPPQHVVRSGESLNSISRRYRVRLNDLANANNLSPREKIAPGSALIIPRKAANAAATQPRPKRATTSRRDVGSTDTSGPFITHTVRNGESLWSISEKYDVTVQQIFRWNGLRKNRIHPGLKLKIKNNTGSSSAVHTKGARARRG